VNTVVGATTVTRISGDDEFVTAGELAKHWPSASDAVIARADDPADALAGSYIAGSHITPILLAQQHSVPQATLDALKRLGTYHVRVLGGEKALGSEVTDALKSAGMKQIDRIAGADRYETAKLVAENSGPANVGQRSGMGPTVILANGIQPADALAAAPLSYGQQWPIVLTATDALPDATKQALDDLHIAHVIVVGGTAAVSDAVVRTLQASGRTVARIAGANRMATAAALGDMLLTIGQQVSRVEVVSTSSTAIALALGPHAAPDAPVLLCASKDDCGTETIGWIKTHAAAVSTVVIAGGTDQISSTAESQLASAAG
jgi:lactocepin